MPGFTKGPAFRTPFGNHNFLGSTRDIKVEGRTCAAASVPSVTIDGVATKVLPKGAVLAKITSAGADQGKVGPRDAGASDGRQTTTNIVGINNTFLPTQLLYRDVEVAVVYEATVVQEWCLEVASGAWVAMTNTTRDATKAGVTTGVSLLYRTPSAVVVDNTNTV